MCVTIRFTLQNLIVKWPFSLHSLAKVIIFLITPPQLGKKLLNIGHINYFFRKEVTTKRDTKEEKETFKSQFNVSNSKKRALSFIQNNKARILYMAL